MIINKSHVDRLKATLTVRDVMSVYLPENKINAKGFALCPFHSEKTPSLAVHPDRYHCFGCGESGDIITLTQKLFNLSFKDSVVKLNKDFGVGLPLENMSIADLVSSAEQYRKITEERKKEAKRLEDLKRLDREFLDIYHNELERLLENKVTYKPKLGDETLDIRYAEAVSEIPRLGAIFDEWGDLVEELAHHASQNALESLNGILTQLKSELSLEGGDSR